MGIRRKTAICLCILLPLICIAPCFPRQKKTSGFSPTKILSPFEPSAKWAIEPLCSLERSEVELILSQDFNYLGSGAQCYAFLSADGNYVLKFFKIKHLVPKKWLVWFPLPGLGKYRFSKVDKRILRQIELFSSYKLAYEQIKQQTGLIYIHLNKSNDLSAQIQLHDRNRNRYVVDLDKHEFVLQKKAQLVGDKISSLMIKGEKEKAVQVFRLLFECIVKQCQRGFIDRDSGTNHNYGFVGDDVIHFDVGRIVLDETAKEASHYQREVLRVGKKLESWLRLQYPQLLESLDEEIQRVLDRTTLD